MSSSSPAGAAALGLAVASALGGPALAQSSAPEPSAPAVSTVVVTAPRGYGAPIVAVGGKTPVDALDLPQAVQAVPEALIRDQAITAFDELLKDVSGAAPASSPAEYNGEIRVRGFRTQPLRDGEPNTYGFDGGSTRDLFVNVERVEVLKGPAAVSFGGDQEGNFGGVINVVMKRPLATPRAEVALSADSFGYVSPSFDVTGPLNASKTALFRLTGAYAHRGSFIDQVSEEAYGLYPTLVLTDNAGTILTLQGEYTRREPVRYFGLPAYGTVTGTDRLRLPIEAYYGEPGLPVHATETQLFTATLEHRFSDAWTGKLVARAYGQHSKYEGAYGQAAEAEGGVTGVEADGRTLDRSYLLYRERDRDYTVDAYVTGRLTVLGRPNVLTLGASDTDYQANTFEALGEIAPIDLLAPVYGAKPTNVQALSPYKDVSNYYGVYAEDLLTLTRRLKLTLGLRYAAFDDSIKADGGFRRSVEAVIPRVGATFEALPGVVLYAGYGEGLSPAFGLYRLGYDPKPESSHQVEGGVKLQRGGLSATIAGFDLVRENGDIPDPTRPQYSLQAGEQESTGVEVDATWSGRNGVAAYLSYGYTDARVTKDAVLPVGDRLQNTPLHAGRLFVSWAPPSGALKGWKLGGGVYAASAREGTLPNSFRLPGFYTLDALIARDFGRYSVQLNLKNLTDERYFESTGSYQEGVFPGQPLTAQVTLRAVY